MIKSEELKIGNWVYNDENKPVKIIAIEDEVFSDWNGSDCSCMFIENDVYKYSTINPIPLTPEVLLKCGFTIDANDDYSIQIDGRIFIWFEKGNCRHMDLYQDGKNISFPSGRIKYVHELQNFYHSLSGKELTIEL